MTHAGNLTNRPAWVDLGTSDAEGARNFYSQLFGWQIEVNPDPQYGGYGIAHVGDHDAAGIGPTQSPEQPTAWSLYIGADDIGALAQRFGEEGGNVVAPPFDVGDQGRMAVFQDPTGAFISAWSGPGGSRFTFDEPNTFAWTELNTRDLQRATDFYGRVFGWQPKVTPGGDGAPPYTEFILDGESVAGALDMPPGVPDEVPAYWLIYFNAPDVDAATQRVAELGGQVVVPPQDFPNGRFSVVTDPQGGTFGLLDYRGTGT